MTAASCSGGSKTRGRALAETTLCRPSPLPSRPAVLASCTPRCPVQPVGCPGFGFNKSYLTRETLFFFLVFGDINARGGVVLLDRSKLAPVRFPGIVYKVDLAKQKTLTPQGRGGARQYAAGQRGGAGRGWARRDGGRAERCAGCRTFCLTVVQFAFLFDFIFINK